MCVFCPWSPLSHGCMRRYGSLLLWFNLFHRFVSSLCRDRLSLNIPWNTMTENGSDMDQPYRNSRVIRTHGQREREHTQALPLWSPPGCSSPLLSGWIRPCEGPYACCSTTALSNNQLLQNSQSGPTPRSSDPACELRQRTCRYPKKPCPLSSRWS